MPSLFDQLPAETRNEIARKAQGLGVSGKGDDTAQKWADLERDLKAESAPVTTPPLTPAEFETILAASHGPSASSPKSQRNWLRR